MSISCPSKGEKSRSSSLSTLQLPPPHCVSRLDSGPVYLSSGGPKLRVRATRRFGLKEIADRLFSRDREERDLAPVTSDRLFFFFSFVFPALSFFFCLFFCFSSSRTRRAREGERDAHWNLNEEERERHTHVHTYKPKRSPERRVPLSLSLSLSPFLSFVT